MSSDNNWLNQAVLIFGPRKSGTTLTQSLLDGGSEVLVRPGELKVKYFVKELWKNREDALAHYYQNKRKIGEFEGHDHKKYLHHVSSENHEVNSLHEIMKEEISCICSALENPPSDLKYWAAKEAGGDIHQIIRMWKRIKKR